MTKALHLSSGNVLAQAIGILTMPILTRLYAPEQYGHLGVYLSVASVLSGLTTLRYEIGILNSPDDRTAHEFAGTALKLSVALNIIIGVGYWLIPIFSEHYFGDPKWLSGFFIAALCFLSNLQVIMRYLFLRTRHSKELLIASPAQIGSRAALQYLFSYTLPRWGLACGEVLGRIPPILLMGRRLNWRRLFTNEKTLLTQLQGERKYPLYLLPSFLIDTLAQTLPIPLLVNLFGLEAAGLFALQQRLWQVPLQIVSEGAADVIHSKFSDAYASSSPIQIRNAFLKSLSSLAVFAAVFAIFFTTLGPSLIPWMLGPHWQIAGDLAAIATPWYAMALIVSPLSRLVLVNGAMKLKLIYDFAALTSVLGVFAVATNTHWTLLQTTKFLAWTNFSTYSLYLLILFSQINRKRSKNSTSEL